jgi:hypothetical protein
MGAIYKLSKTIIFHNLSWPPGRSGNAFIPTELCSVTYISEDAVRAVKLHSRGELMSKVDLKDAYKQIGVRSDVHKWHRGWQHCRTLVVLFTLDTAGVLM